MEIKLCKKCKKPVVSGEYCIDCNVYANQITTEKLNIKHLKNDINENIEKYKRDNKYNSLKPQVIAIQFFHHIWADIYCVLYKKDGFYEWNEFYSETEKSFTIDGVEYNIFTDKIPNWVYKSTGIDSFAWVNSKYKDIVLIDDWYIYYSKEEIPVLNKKLSEEDIRDANIYGPIKR